MRMWMVNPKVMCNQHLLGEHVEIHMIMGSLKKGISLTGYINKGLVDIKQIPERHYRLAREMKSRGMKHKSPLYPMNHSLFSNQPAGNIEKELNLMELRRRCKACRARIIKGGY